MKELGGRAHAGPRHDGGSRDAHGGYEPRLVEKGEYIARLEEKLARATSNLLRLEGQLQSCQLW